MTFYEFIRRCLQVDAKRYVVPKQLAEMLLKCCRGLGQHTKEEEDDTNNLNIEERVSLP